MIQLEKFPVKNDTIPLESLLFELFQESPVWLISEILEKVHEKKVHLTSIYSLKKALSTFSYSFRDGPFKTAYIRLDFDPKINVDSVKYQVFSFMISGDLNGNNRGRKFIKWILLKDCKDPQILETFKRFVQNSVNARFDVFSKERIWMV